MSPMDPGAALGEYRERWTSMSAYEKCLYYWAEVNGFGLNQQKQLGIPWLQLRFEDLFGGQGLDNLLDFLGLPRRPAIFEARTRTVDRFRYLSFDGDTSLSLALHPKIDAIAKELGYNLSTPINTRERQRYFGR